MAWSEWLRLGTSPQMLAAIRCATQTGRPLGGRAFLEELEALSHGTLQPQKRGPKPKEDPRAPTPDLFEGVW